MKSEDLMVGDYLTFPDVQNDSNCPKLRVVVINEEDVYVSVDGDPVADLCDPKDLAGIPLTPEILEKNGFHFAKADRISITDRYILGVKGTREEGIVEITFYNPDVHGVKVLTKIHTQSSHESGINSMHSCDIESVHELQRALRLCKIDKTIEL